MVERVSTGIEGLDENLEGGFPKSSVALITGGPGAGKTTFCSHFIEEGLDKDQECLYITTGQKPEDIKADAEELGINLDHSDLAMARISPSNDVASNIKEKVVGQDFDRIVLDSLSVFEMYWGEKDHLRKYINQLVDHLSDIDATVLITSERPENRSGRLSRFGIAEFVVDGVIKIEGFALGDASYRSMQVVKMRQTRVNGEVLDIELDRNGLIVSASEKF